MIDGSHPSHSSSSDDRIRRKIEALGNSLSLPTVRKALGVLEGEHASNRRGGNDDPMDIRVYGPGDEARLIDWKASARLGRPMVVQHARQATSQVWLLCDVGEEMTGGCASGEPAYAVAGNALRMFAALSLRRSDDVSLVFADAHSITRMPFNGGFAQFERTLDDALRRDCHTAATSTLCWITRAAYATVRRSSCLPPTSWPCASVTSTSSAP